jgi:hypothetical protein
VAVIAEDAAGDGVFDGTARTSQDCPIAFPADLPAPRCGPACPRVCGAAAVGYPVAVPATNHRGSGITDASPLCRSPGWQPQRHSASTIGRRRAALRSGDRPARPRRTHPQPYALNRSPPEPHRRTGCGARASRPRRPSSEAERRRAGGGRSPLRLSVRVVRHSRSVPVECRLSGALMKASASGRDEAPGHTLQPLGALEQPMGRATSHGQGGGQPPCDHPHHPQRVCRCGGARGSARAAGDQRPCRSGWSSIRVARYSAERYGLRALTPDLGHAESGYGRGSEMIHDHGPQELHAGVPAPVGFQNLGHDM